MNPQTRHTTARTCRSAPSRTLQETPARAGPACRLRGAVGGHGGRVAYTPDEVRKMIAAGESQTVEFKSRVPDFRTVARLISAFGNAEGGVVLVGVDDRGETPPCISCSAPTGRTARLRVRRVAARSSLA